MCVWRLCIPQREGVRGKGGVGLCCVRMHLRLRVLARVACLEGYREVHLLGETLRQRGRPAHADALGHHDGEAAEKAAEAGRLRGVDLRVWRRILVADGRALVFDRRASLCGCGMGCGVV